MTYIIQAGDTLHSIAQKFQISVEQLKKWNNLTNQPIRIGQIIRVSEGAISNLKHTVQVGESLYSIARKYSLTVTELKQLNPLASSTLRVGQELVISQIQTNKPTIPQTTTLPKEGYHLVASGDSLYSIARQYSVTVAHLVKLNGLLSNALKIGQQLKIVESVEDFSTTNQTVFYTVKQGDSLYSISQQFQITVNQLVLWNRLTSMVLRVGQILKIAQTQEEKKQESTVNESSEWIEHSVAKGETLYGIAKKYQTEIQLIKNINPQLTERLVVGQSLKILKPEKLPDTNEKENIAISVSGSSTFPNITPENAPQLLKSVIEARKIFQMEVLDGLNILADGLKSAVGRNRVNRPDDLLKVQKRLVELKMLVPHHNEFPEQILDKIGGGAITANWIPRTIEAIERFQNHFKVRFWIEHSSRVALMRTNSFTQGVIVPDDITYKILREFTEYKITFPHPQDQKPITVRFENFPRTMFTKYYQGVSYIGNSNPEIPLSVFNRLGLEKNLAEALQFVSRHEGNFDAINSYDDAIFSYGFIQFAGNGGGLAPFLASVKQKAPAIFQEFFQQFGIDVVYEFQQNELKNTKLLVIDPYDKGGKILSEGLEAERVLRSDIQLYGAFMRAGFHLPIITLQIDAAIRQYIRPAAGIKLPIQLNRNASMLVPITDLIRSPMGLAALIDLAINRWIIKTQEIFKEAIEQVAHYLQIQKVQDLYRIDEKRIIEQILKIAQQNNDSRLTQRMGNILNSHLSSEK